MMTDPAHGISRWVAPAAVLLGAMLHGGCGDGGAVGGDSQFLARRVEALEAKVRELEAKASGAPGSGAAPAAPATAPSKAALPGSTPASVAGEAAVAPAPVPAGVGLTDQLASEEDRANIFLLKVKQIQAAPRAQLPQLIVDLGINAPEIGDYRNQIAGLEQEKARLSADAVANAPRLAEVEEEVEKLKFRLEIAAEGVRSRLIEEGKELSARVAQKRSAAEDSPGGVPAAKPGSP